MTLTRDVNKDLTPKDQDKDKDLTPKDQDKDLLYLTPQGQGPDPQGRGGGRASTADGESTGGRRASAAPRVPSASYAVARARFKESLELVSTAHDQFANPPNPPLNFIYPPLALSSATFHSRLKTELFKISYPGSTPSPSHVRHHHRLQP